MSNIKVLAAIPKRKDISEQAFHDHWRHPHGTLSRKIACLRGYVQSHRTVTPLLSDTQMVYDGITELWYDSLDDALTMGQDPAHRKYNVPDEPLFVDMDGLRFVFLHEEVLRSRPDVNSADDAAVQWSPTDWSVSVKLIQLIDATGKRDWAGDADRTLGDRIGAYRHTRSHYIPSVHGEQPPFLGARELWWPTLTHFQRGVESGRDALDTLLARAGSYHAILAQAERVI